MMFAGSGMKLDISIDMSNVDHCGDGDEKFVAADAFRENPKHLNGAANLSELTYLELPNVLHNLKYRYDRREIYTSMNEILVAVNPYQVFPQQYSDERIREFQESPRKRREIPHIYATAARALHDLFVKRRSQSIIVCGESGSGKTESSKSVQAYITATSKQAAELASKNINIEAQVLAVNPILEGFGNATTTMNDNSSRFAKFTKIVFERLSTFEGRSRNVAKQLREAANIPIVGSVIQTYLLEKSRVIFQDNGEMNFHIFYQLFQLPNDLKQRFGLVEGNKRCKFAYLNHGMPADTMPKYSAKALEEVRKAFSVLGVVEERQAEILGVVASILHLGNVNFEASSSDNTLEIEKSCRKHLEKAAELLHLDVVALEERLLGRWIRAGGGDPILKHYMEQDEATENRDSVSKTIYQGLFTHVVDVINAHLLPNDPNESEFDEDNDYQVDDDTQPFIGILDVFGFECFEHNSLEQYCINFANECLQQFFNECVIASEQDEYVREAVEWEAIEVPDNEERIQMIKTGFKELHSTCKMPKGEPEYFVQNFIRRFPKSPYVVGLGPQSMANTRSQSRVSSPRSGIAHSRLKPRSHTPSHPSRARSRSTVMPQKVVNNLRLGAGGSGSGGSRQRNSMQRRRVPGTPNAKGGRPANDSFGTENSGFQVSHYAGNVAYVAKDFLKKNRDYPHIDTVPLLCNSDSEVVSALVAPDSGEEAGGGKRQGSNKSSVGAVFMKQMDVLMDHLGQTDPFFVRCLTPNPHKVAKMFDSHYVSKQLRCGGLIEALSVQKKGYPTRVEYAKIHEFYSHVPALQFMKTFSKPDFCEAILLGFEVPADGYKLGTSKVFFKSHAAHMLQQILASKRKAGPPADVIERVKHWRRQKLIRKWRVVVRSSIILVRTLRGLRATNMWYHTAGIVHTIARTIMPTLKRVRRRIYERKLKGSVLIVERWRRFKVDRDRFVRHMEQKRALQRAVDNVSHWRRFKLDRDRFLAHLRDKRDEEERQRKVLEEAERIRRKVDAAAEVARRDGEARERRAREEAEAEMRRKIEAEAAEQRRKMEEETDRLRKETELLRKEAEETAARLRKEAEEAAERRRQQELDEEERRRRDKAESDEDGEYTASSTSSTGKTRHLRRRTPSGDGDEDLSSASSSENDEGDTRKMHRKRRHGHHSVRRGTTTRQRSGSTPAHKSRHKHRRKHRLNGPDPGGDTPIVASRHRTRSAMSPGSDGDDASASMHVVGGDGIAEPSGDNVGTNLRDEFDDAMSNSVSGDDSLESSTSGESDPGTGVSLAQMQAVTERMDRQEKLLLDTISALNRVGGAAPQQANANANGSAEHELTALQRHAVVQQMRQEVRSEMQSMDNRLRHLETHSQMHLPADTSPVSLLWRIPKFVMTRAFEFPFDVVRSIVNGVRYPASSVEPSAPNSVHGPQQANDHQPQPQYAVPYHHQQFQHHSPAPFVPNPHAHHSNGGPYLLSPQSLQLQPQPYVVHSSQSQQPAPSAFVNGHFAQPPAPLPQRNGHSAKLFTSAVLPLGSPQPGREHANVRGHGAEPSSFSPGDLGDRRQGQRIQQHPGGPRRGGEGSGGPPGHHHIDGRRSVDVLSSETDDGVSQFAYNGRQSVGKFLSTSSIELLTTFVDVLFVLCSKSTYSR